AGGSPRPSHAPRPRTSLPDISKTRGDVGSTTEGRRFLEAFMEASRPWEFRFSGCLSDVPWQVPHPPRVSLANIAPDVVESRVGALQPVPEPVFDDLRLFFHAEIVPRLVQIPFAVDICIALAAQLSF